MVEALRNVLCQKVCASSQFSLFLSAAGKVRWNIECAFGCGPAIVSLSLSLSLSLQVYSCGNGSGVGKGNTEPRQYTPAIIEHLDQEIIIDIVTGDGHCLALTQSKFIRALQWYRGKGDQWMLAILWAYVLRSYDQTNALV